MNRLADQLLDLARKESPAHTKPLSAEGIVNLFQTAREAAASVRPIAECIGRAIEIEDGAEPKVRGFPDELRDMFRNLLDKALTHGIGTIRIRILEREDCTENCFIYVEGNGCVKLSENLFRQFRKGNPGSPGAGLELAIVRQVARNHGGDATITQGRALSICVRLPIA